ncbi:MAG: hypothetical protein EAZ24_05545 [Burkholderiales bacterium]|nr:MAG: hypothetical protein EAZ24_05545 [Burkholderiales bacterium]TAG81421.1 MAG: hypothetical protein EAZ21_06205 [Betaproteobacteria bacterium]
MASDEGKANTNAREMPATDRRLSSGIQIFTRSVSIHLVKYRVATKPGATNYANDGCCATRCVALR